MYELINDIKNYTLPSQLPRNIHVDWFNFSVVSNHYQNYRISIRTHTNKMWEEHFVDWLLELRFERGSYRLGYILNYKYINNC